MGWGDKTIYNDPEHFGLKQEFSCEASNASYSFDMLVVWRKLDDGSLWYATDSGCSCPSPFEGYASFPATLTRVANPADLHDVLDRCAYETEYNPDTKDWDTLTQELNSDWTISDVVEGHKRISELEPPKMHKLELPQAGWANADATDGGDIDWPEEDE